MREATGHSFFARYRGIIVAVILFMTADSLVIAINFYSTFKANESAVSINLSGRQRMLSQRMTKVLLLLQRSQEVGDSEGVERNLKELSLTVNLFDTTLKGFRDGSIVTGGDGSQVFLTQVDTDVSRQIVTDAYAIWDPYLEVLRPLLGNGWNATQLENAVRFAQSNNLEVLRLMNDLTSDLELVANNRARFLRIVLVLGIVVALGNFIYTVIFSIRNLIKSDEKIVRAQEETTEIFATVHEGLFLLNKDGTLGTQFSASLPQMLRRGIHPGMDFIAVLKEMVSPSVFEAATDYIELLLGDRVKEALVTSLNPLTNVPVSAMNQMGAETEYYLSFFFNRVMVGGEISHLLVTVQDVTEQVSLMHRLEQAKKQSKTEVEALLRLLGGDFDSLRHFIANVELALSEINKGLNRAQDDNEQHLHTLAKIMRIVHGVKGEAAALGVDVLESYAHECEKEMVAMRESEEGVTGDHMLRISVLLEGFYERYSSLAEIIERFAVALGKTLPEAEDKKAADAGKAPPPIAQQIAALVQRIAKDQNKQIDVSCQLEMLSTLPAHISQELQGVSIQLVRNALTHGIETPAERHMLQKPEKGKLQLWFERLDNAQYDFVVRDDGRGIVPERLRAHLAKSGKMGREEAARLSDREVMSMLFQPGFSTAASANRDAGHGIGLDIVLEKVKGINGRLLVKSRPDLFTEFRIRFNAAT
ncbi:MAG: type IV pili methyl-accepting chemotaxis transducer N-terminal domain-containing protein [Zoogloeaceae bacterium]|nr:type IV pili methyl-accepting chemotaxis transducer N-terminal domain-containing protein [Zoogloeaceae bacterium]